MSKEELENLGGLNVEAYPGKHREWAEMCSYAAKEEIIYRENELKIQSHLPNAEKDGLVNKFNKRINGLVNKISNFLECAQRANSADDQRSILNMASIAMGLARDINSSDPSTKDVVKNMLRSIVCKDANSKKVLRNARNFHIGPKFVDMQVVITHGIQTLCESQKKTNGSKFNFNVKNIANPVEPKELVEMLFAAAS